MNITKHKSLKTHLPVAIAVTTTVLLLATKIVNAQFIGNAKDGAGSVGGSGSGGGSTTTITGLLQSITSALLFLVGAASVIMLIIGGIRFVTSSGDAQATTSARNTIIYSIVGVIVAVSAYAIVSFTIGVVDKNATNDPGVAPDATPTVPGVDVAPNERLAPDDPNYVPPGVDVSPTTPPDGTSSGVDVAPSGTTAEPVIDANSTP